MAFSGGKLLLLCILWLIVIASAMSVVYVTFDVRRHTSQLAQLNDQSQRLQVETGQLLLEKSTLASYARVEKIATNQLNMRVPNGHDVVVVNIQ